MVGVGHAHLAGVTVRDDEGQPVQMAEPLVTDDERELIAAELERTKAGPKERRQSGPLVGVLVCYFCGSGLSSTVNKGKHGRKYSYYRCHVNGCTAMIPAADAEKLAEETFLDEYGDQDVTQRVWVPGDSHEADLRAAVAAFDELSASAEAMTSRTAKDRLQRQLAALDARIAELENTPAREGRWEFRSTGEKYRDVWERHADDPAARRDMLKKAGISLRIGIAGRRSHTSGGAWHFDIKAEPTASVQTSTQSS